MGLEDKLNLIENIKEDIRNIIIDKGVYVAKNTPFNKYPNYIQQIAPKAIDISGIQWTPDPLWWDIKTILENDVNDGDNAYLDGYGKCIVLFDDTADTTNFSLIAKSVTTANNSWYAVKTSDGQLYTTTSTSAKTTTHTWDKTQDKQSSCPELKTRYAIFYKDSAYNLQTSGTAVALPNALYVISNGINWRQGSTSSIEGNCFGDKCQGLELYGIDAYTGGGSGSNSLLFKGISLQHLILDCVLNNAIYGSLAKCFKLQYWKLTNLNYSSIDDNGIKTYNLPSGSDLKLNTLDVSDIDFTQAGSNIFTNLYVTNIQGIINLENNISNASYTLFRTQNYAPMTFSLNLPNANVTLNCEYITPETAKYLVENAPTVTESRKLTLPSQLYNYIKSIPYTHLVNYKGQNYSDGIQVLTLKGWTVISD